MSCWFVPAFKDAFGAFESNSESLIIAFTRLAFLLDSSNAIIAIAMGYSPQMGILAGTIQK